MLVKTGAHALNQQAHRFARNRGETLDPQNAVADHQLRQGFEQHALFGLGKLDGDGVERVVIVVVMVIAFMVMIVMAVAAVDVRFRAVTQPQQHIERQTAAAGFDDFDRRRQFF